MEHLQGRSLRSYLRDEGALDAARSLEWVDQICAALQEAHGMNLVHRDIKPSNLFVVEGDHLEAHLKLVDFGLAKSTAVSSEDLTDTGVLVGSPAYMAPEQVRAAPASSASDVWSVGVVLYYMLSKRLPFERPSSSAVLAAIAADPPTPLREFVPEAPKAVLDVIAKCLRKSPDERFASSDELRRSLAHARALLAADLEKEPEPTFGVDSLSTLRSLSLQPASARVRRAKWALPVCIGAGVVWVLAFGWRRSAQLREPKNVAPSALPVASHPAHVQLTETPRAPAPTATSSSATPAPAPTPALRAKQGMRERSAGPSSQTGTATPAPLPSGAPSRLVAEPNF
jgi:eukaryotic-like serine/threonine-protein kinase